MAVPKNRSHNKSSDSVQEEHMTTWRLLQQLSPDPEFLIQQTESRVNQGVLTNAKISDRVQPCENVKGDTRTTPEESSVSEFQQAASDNLTGLGQSGECTSHCRGVMLAQDNRNVVGLPSAEDKLVNDKKKTELCLSLFVEDHADQYENQYTVTTEKDTFENDQDQDTYKYGQPLVHDTCENHKSSVHNSHIPERQIVPDLRHKKEDLIPKDESPKGMSYYFFFSCLNQLYLAVGMSYMLFSFLRPNRPYFVTRMMYMQFSVHQPNGPYFVTRMMYMQFSVHQPNGPYFVTRMMYMQFSVHQPNGPYLVTRMMYMLFSVHHRDGPYLVAKMMYLQCVLLCRNKAYALYTGKACMKPVCHLFVKDFDVTRKGCFPKSDQQKYGNNFLESLSTPLYNQEVQLQVYAVVNYNYMYGPIQPPQQNGAGVLAVSDHESPPQLHVYNQLQHQNNPAPVEIPEGPIQPPQQNGAGVLAVSDHELPLQLYNQLQHQNNPAPVEIPEGPIQPPQQNGAGVLAVSDHESPPQLHVYNQLQHQNNPAPVEIPEGPIQPPQQNGAGVLAIADHEPNPNTNNQHADQNQQLVMGIAVAFVVMAILIAIFFI